MCWGSDEQHCEKKWLPCRGARGEAEVNQGACAASGPRPANFAGVAGCELSSARLLGPKAKGAVARVPITNA